MANRFIRYVMDGAKLEYDIGFDITNDKGVSVYVNRQKLDQALSYSVVGTLDDLREGNGKIRLTDAHKASDSLLILSSTIEERVTNFAQAARFEEAEIDAEFNNLLRLLEDAALTLTSTPYFDPADTGLVNGKLPPLIAGGVLRVNNAKNGFELVELDKVPEFQEAYEKAKQEADRSEQKADEAAQTVAGFDQHAETKKQEIDQLANNAADSAELSRKWAEGETPSGDPVSDTNNSKYWAGQAKQELFNKIDKVGGDNGAARIPVGTEAQAPDTASETLALIRLLTGQGFVGYDPTTKEWGSLGGGLVKPLATSDLVIAAKRNSSIEVNLADNQPRAINIPAGWAVGSYYIVQTANWTGNKAATVIVNLDSSEEFDRPDGDETKRRLLVRGGETVSIMKTAQGKYAVVAGLPNMRAVKKGRTPLNGDGGLVSNGGDVALTIPMDNFDDLEILCVFSTLQQVFRVSVDSIKNPVKNVMQLVRHMDAGSAVQYASIGIDISASTSNSLRVVAAENGYPNAGIYKVTGIKY